MEQVRHTPIVLVIAAADFVVRLSAKVLANDVGFLLFYLGQYVVSVEPDWLFGHCPVSSDCSFGKVFFRLRNCFAVW